MKMKKLFYCLLVVSILLTAIQPVVFAAEETTDGSRDYNWYQADEDTYKISSAAALMGFNDILTGSNGQTKSDFAGKTVLLTKDIVISDTPSTACVWNGGGTFNGNLFDGCGHSIKGLYIKKENASNAGVGMFGWASGTIQNVSLINAVVDGQGSSHVGSIVGQGTTGFLKLINVYSDATVTTTGSQVGGLVGSCNGLGTDNELLMENCTFAGSVSGTGDVGGIIGYIPSISAKAVTMNRCTFMGSITATGANIGGIAGRSNKIAVTIQNCTNSGTIISKPANTGTAVYVGGMIGLMSGATLTLTGCVYRGTMNIGGARSGGIVGLADTNSCIQIDSCVVSGSMTTRSRGALVVGMTNGTGTDGNKTNITNLLITTTFAGNSAEDCCGLISYMNGTNSIACSNILFLPELSNVRTVMGCNNAAATGITFNHIYYSESQYNKLTHESKSVFGSGCMADTSGVKALSDKDLEALNGTVGNLGTAWTARAETYPVPTAVLANSAELAAWQSKENGEVNGTQTFDYRLIFSLQYNEFKQTGVGCELSLTYNGKDSKAETVSCSTIYSSVIGNGMTCSASSFGGDYLYVVVIRGVPSSVESFDVTVKPFVNTGVGEPVFCAKQTVTIGASMSADVGFKPEIRVMSFNVHNDLSKTDGTGSTLDDDSSKRVAAVKAEIESYSPDLLGLQEDVPAWTENLQLDGYTHIYDPEVTGTYENCSIWVKNSLASGIKESGWQWLTSGGTNETVALTVADITGSGEYALTAEERATLNITTDTPDSFLRDATDVTYTDAEGNEKTAKNVNYLTARRMTYVVLEVKGQKIIYVNTHLQSSSKDADYMTDALLKLRNSERLKQFSLIQNKIDELKQTYADALVVVTGDFNDEPNSDIYKKACDSYLDSSKVAKSVSGTGTWNAAYSKPVAPESKTVLDYCFVSKGFTVRTYRTGLGYVTVQDGESEKKIYTSDHKCVVVNLNF